MALEGRRSFVRAAAAGLAFFAAILVTSLAASPASARYASYVVDADSGEVLHAVNEETRNFPASLTKLMTLYLLFQALDEHKVRLDSKLIVSRHAARQPASHLGLQAGQSISVRDAIQALIVVSANDVAVVVGEALGGTERKFALKMTAEARKIGMHRTTFRNASGLPNRGQMSTARDMSILARQLMHRFGHYFHYFAQLSFTWDGVTHRTHNEILNTYDGADGLKTGYIHASGFNLVATVERDGHRLIGVVFGGNTAHARDKHMATLLDRAFAEVSLHDMAEAGIRPKRKPEPEPVQTVSRTRTIKASANADDEEVWGIQVGAFYTRGPALDAARKAAARLGELAAGGDIALMPLAKRRNRVLYRARILGIGRHNAYRACKMLERHKTPCMELRLPPGEDVAAAGPSSSS